MLIRSHATDVRLSIFFILLLLFLFLLALRSLSVIDETEEGRKKKVKVDEELEGRTRVRRREMTTTTLTEFLCRKKTNTRTNEVRRTSSSFSTRQSVTLQHSSPLLTTTSFAPTSQAASARKSGLTVCPETPPDLVGWVAVDTTKKDIRRVEEKNSGDVLPGGFFRPPLCSSRHRVAVIIPFRDREDHLNIFLDHMMPFLKNQQLHFAIYVVELAKGVRFNRAMLMNIGFKEASLDADWQCFVFHDVDLLPEIDFNLYSCPASPRHMSAAVDVLDYKLPYRNIFGGVTAFSKADFEAVNGFSNVFFGWGGEDDDLFGRASRKGLRILRYPMKIARYTMVRHKQAAANPERHRLIRGGQRRMERDGLNSLQYSLLKKERRKLYTRISVYFDERAVTKTYGSGWWLWPGGA